MESKFKRILVVDDDHILRNEMIETLVAEGFEVKSAENGVVAIQVAKQFFPHLIIINVMMPYLNGYEVAAELHRDEKFYYVPFLFLIRKIDEMDAKRGLEVDSMRDLAKPFTQEELLRQVEAMFARLAR